jgi:hypothetical protein
VHKMVEAKNHRLAVSKIEAAIMVFQKVNRTTVINQTESEQTRKMRKNWKDKRKKTKAGKDKIYLAS